MPKAQFDAIAKLFARRKAVAGMVSAQDATPEATVDAGQGKKIPYLFVQSFEGGTIAPKEGADGTYTATLTHGLGQTLYFADRPSRDVGATPTGQFLSSIGFPDDNPPNAAIVVDDGAGGTDIAVAELRNPVYDADTHTATYDLKVLENWEDSTELGLQDAPADLSNLPASLGPTHLFIDDCPNDSIICRDSTGNTDVGSYDNQPYCYNYLVCMPCEPYWHVQPDRCSTGYYWDDKCQQDFGSDCEGDFGCVAFFNARFVVCGD